MKALEIINVKKSFGKKEVLKDISFSIDQGEILGLLGRNGAGKSTLMKIICGLMDAESGQVLVFENDIKTNRKEALQNIGVNINEPALYKSLTGMDNLEIVANWKNISKNRLMEMVEFTRLGNNIKKKVSTYSTGMKVRLMLAMVLMSKPKLIILDEPTNGLDPDGIIELRNILRSLKEQNCSILFSSHQLSEMEKLASRVIFMEGGEIVNEIKDLRNLSSKARYLILVDNETKLEEIFDKYKLNYKKDKYYEFIIEKNFLNKLLEELVTGKVEIKDLVKKEFSLEDLYLETIRNDW